MSKLFNRLPRKSRTRYNFEIIMPEIGKVYGFKNYKIDDDEIVVRLKFRSRKYRGGFGWDVDRRQMHIYSVREQKHKWFRFGWLFYCCRKENGPLCNLRYKR